MPKPSPELPARITTKFTPQDQAASGDFFVDAAMPPVMIHSATVYKQVRRLSVSGCSTPKDARWLTIPMIPWHGPRDNWTHLIVQQCPWCGWEETPVASPFCTTGP